MIQVYGAKPFLDLPDVSPFVTKLITYLRLTSLSSSSTNNPLPWSYNQQPPQTLSQDAPAGKLPYIIDTSSSSSNSSPLKLGDSSIIISYLESTYPSSSLDSNLSPQDRALSLAFERLLCDHLSWSGLVWPRWKLDSGFEVYWPHLMPEGMVMTPDLRVLLDQTRLRYVAQLDAQGMGRRDDDTILQFFRRDVDAVAGFLGEEKEFFLGRGGGGGGDGNGDHGPTSVDASVYAILKHIVVQPCEWPGKGYVESKGNLMRYLERMDKLLGGGGV